MKHPPEPNIAEAAMRRLGPDDIQDLAALERQCFSCPWTEDQYAQVLDSSRLVVVGANHLGRLLGYCSFYHAGDELEILNLATSPDCRRQGLGRRILAFVLRIGQQMGIEQVVLEVRITNHPARRLYENMGFEQAGVRKKYYPDTGEDALVLVRRLPREPIPSTCNDHRGCHEKVDGGQLEDVQNP